MTKRDFTADFYRHLYDAIREYTDDLELDGCDTSASATLYVDGCEVELTVEFSLEWIDESFDHAFGTWHDPYPYYRVSCIEGVDDVRIYDEETGDEIEGFDCGAFMAQFDVPSHIFSIRGRHMKVQSGDTVSWCGKDAVFLAYNRESGKVKVRTDKGDLYTDQRQIKVTAA